MKVEEQKSNQLSKNAQSIGNESHQAGTCCLRMPSFRPPGMSFLRSSMRMGQKLIKRRCIDAAQQIRTCRYRVKQIRT